MPDHADDKSTISHLVEEVLRTLDAKGRAALGTYLELEAQMVGKYQDQLGTLFEKQADVQREFARLVTTAFSNASQLQAHYRNTVRDTHDTVLKAHLDFVNHLRSSLSQDAPKDAPRPRSARGGKARKP